MTKADCLNIVRLLSAVESWGFATGNRLPDYLHDDLCAMVTKLCAEILGEASEVSARLGQMQSTETDQHTSRPQRGGRFETEPR